MNPLKHRAWCQQCAVVVLHSEEFLPVHFSTTANLNIDLVHPFTMNLKYIQTLLTSVNYWHFSKQLGIPMLSHACSEQPQSELLMCSHREFSIWQQQ